MTAAQKGRGIERGYFVTAACAMCIIIFITRFDPRKREKAGKWTWRGRRSLSDVTRSRISTVESSYESSMLIRRTVTDKLSLSFFFPCSKERQDVPQKGHAKLENLFHIHCEN